MANYLKTELYDLIKKDNRIFEFIQEKTLDGLCFWDIKNPENKWMNKRFWEVLGYHSEETSRKTIDWQNVIHPEDLSVAIESLQTCIKNPETSYDQQLRYHHKDGSVIWMKSHGLIIRNDEGIPVRMLEAHQDITSLKQTEEKLRIEQQQLNKNEELYRFITENTTDVIRYQSPSGEFEYVSPNIKELTGYSSEEYIKFGPLENVFPEDHPILKQAVERMNAGEKTLTVEYRLYHKTRKVIWVQTRLKAICNKEGQPHSLLSSTNDITHQKQLQIELAQSEEKYKAMYINAPLAFQSLDIDGNILEVNPQWLKTLAHAKDEVIGKWFGDFLHPEYVEHFRKNFPRFKKQGFINDVQFRMKKKNGDFVYVSFEGCIGYTPEGDFKQTYCTFKDITTEKAIEVNLKKSEERYRLIFETAANLITSVNKDGIIVDCNKQVSEILGYSKDEIVGNPMTKIMHPDYHEKALKSINTIITQGYNYNQVYKMVRKDGTIIDVNINASAIKNNGVFERTICIIDDITEKLAADIKIKDSLNLLNSFINNFPDDVWAKDSDGRMTLANQFVKENVFGRDDILGKTVYDFFPQKLADEYWASEKKVLLNDETTQTEELIPQSDGMHSKILTKFPLHNSNGEVIGLGAIAHNITERKKAELALKQSEEKFRGVFEDSNVGIAIGSAHGEVLEVNEEYLKITGYSRDEFVNLNYADITHPDDLEKELSLFEQLHKGEINNYRIVKRLRAKSGNYIWLDCAITGRKDENDHIDQTIAIVVDINEGKKATETVNVFFELPMNIHFIGTIDGQILKINTGWEEILGYCKEESIGKNIFDFIHPDDFESTNHQIADLKNGKRTFYFENRYKHKNGHYITLAWSAIFNTTAKLIHGIAKDITQQKAFHEALLQSEENYKALSENAKHIILTHNFDGEITYANKYYLDFIGLPKEKIIGTDIKLMVQEDDDIRKMQHRINDFMSGDFKIHQYELNITRQSGENRIVEVVSSPLKLNNKVDSVLVTAYDITERKAAEENIQQKLLSEGIISQTATNFIQSDNIDKSINQAFEALGSINKASRIYLFQVDEFNGTMSNTHEWCNDGVTAEINNLQNIPVEDFRWWMNKMYLNEVINIPDVSKMPSEAAAEKLVLEQQEIHSLLVLPIFINNKLFGYVGFDNIEESKEWHSTDIYLLEMLASILSNAIAQKNAKQKLLEQNEEFETLNEELRQTNDELFTTIKREEEINDRFNKAMEATSDGLWDWDLVTNAIYYSPRWKAMLGYRVDELPNEFSVWEELTYPEDVQRSWKKLTALIDGKEEKFDIEFKMKHKKGHWVDINSRANVFRNNKGKAIRVVGTHADITERKIAENKLRESEESLKLSNSRYIKAEEMGKVGNWEYIIETDEFWASNESKRIYGFDLEDKSFTTEVVESCIPERERVHQALIDLIEHNKPYNLEFDLIAKNTGERKTITSKAELISDENGNPRKIVGVIQDITERKIAENKLRESEEKLRLAIDNSPLGITINDMNGGFISVNKAYEKIVGYSKNELKKMSFFDITHPDYLPKNQQLFDAMAQNKAPGFAIDKKYIHKSGKLIDVRIHAGSIHNVKGEALFGMAFTEDITERKALEQMNSMLSKAIESSPVIVVITNKNGDIEYVNPFFTKATGYSKEEVIGQNPRLLQSGIHCEAFYNELWQTLLSGKTWVGEFQNKKKNGTLYWENAAISPIVNSQGEILQFVAVKEDITELKQTLLDLERAKEKAEEANALKTEFLHNMSHEIRTPMNGIMGFSNLLCELEGCSEAQNNYSQIIHNSSSQLLSIIDDILEISTLETKQLSVQESEIDLNQFTMELFSIYDLKSKERNLPLYVTKGLPSGQCTMLSDKVKLNKIITNLLDNAFKFTNTGKIEFGYKMDLPNIVFFVRDTGVGISSDKMSRIFDRFSQESAETAQTYGGLGLGLSIAKENTELLGGIISVESEKNVGTTFSVEIPYTPSNGDADATTESTIFDAESTDSLQILVAEDEETNYLYFEAILEDFSDKKIKLHHAIHGEEAVAICLNNKAISLVLMDIKMPVMDGYKATQLIKEKRPDLPIIAQTAYSTASEREMALSHGCDDFISKPIKKEDLLQLIDKYTNK